MSYNEGPKNGKYKHGMAKSREYAAWQNMVQRCTNKNHPRFKDWGGRGIGISEDWLDFTNFYKDMGDRPSKQHTLERKDNRMGYSKDNCCWATTKEQGVNRRSNRVLTANGYSFTVVEWSERLQINRVTLSSRLRRGWSIQEALSGKRYV
jgi:hypothetical protein